MTTYYLSLHETHGYLLDLLRRIDRFETRPTVWCPITRSGEELLKILVALATEKYPHLLEGVRLVSIAMANGRSEVSFPNENAEELRGQSVLLLDGAIHSGGMMGLFTRLFGTTLAIPAGAAERSHDPEWLMKWRAANRKPIWESSDSTSHPLIRAIRLNESVTIRYFGGSSPGESRVITPSLLFTCDGYSGTWVSAYCHERRQQRTFRMDCISLK